MSRLLLSLIFFLGYAGAASASSALSDHRKDPYVVLLASNLTEKSGANGSFRDFVVRLTDTPLLSVNVKSEMHTFSDVIDGLLSENKKKENDALQALADSYSFSLAQGKNDTLASALIDITNCRETLADRVLIEADRKGFTYSLNLQDSPYTLFFVGTVDEQHKKEKNVIGWLTSDLTAQIAGKMTSKFAKDYSNNALASLKLDIDSRKSALDLWNQINAAWLQLVSLNKKIGISGMALIVSETPKDCKVDPLTTFPKFFEFLKNMKCEKEIIKTEKLAAYLTSLSLVCDLYNAEVEEKGKKIQQKRERLLENSVYKFSESILCKFRENPIFSGVLSEFEESLKLGRWGVQSRYESGIAPELTKLEEAFKTWMQQDMREYLQLKKELKSFQISHDIFSKADKILVEKLVAPYHNFLTENERLLLMKFTHFLKLQFN